MATCRQIPVSRRLVAIPVDRSQFLADWWLYLSTDPSFPQTGGYTCRQIPVSRRLVAIPVDRSQFPADWWLYLSTDPSFPQTGGYTCRQIPVSRRLVASAFKATLDICFSPVCWAAIGKRVGSGSRGAGPMRCMCTCTYKHACSHHQLMGWAMQRGPQ